MSTLFFCKFGSLFYITTQTYSMTTGGRPETAGGPIITCRSFSSIPSFDSGYFLASDLLQSSTRKAMVPIARPTTNTIIMIPNWLRISGWLCRTVGSGIGIGGLIKSYFTLSRIPVSLSHIIVLLNWTFAIKVWLKLCFYNIIVLLFTCSGLPLGVMKVVNTDSIASLL